MGYGFNALNSASLTPMNHEKDGIHFVWKTNRSASVICKNVAMNHFVQRLNQMGGDSGKITNGEC
jgi:hypothetical protein